MTTAFSAPAARGRCAGFAVSLRVEDARRQVELLLQLHRPLLAQRCRANHQQPALALRPELAEHDARFDRLAEADLVGQDHALGERRLEREERGFDLVRVEIDRRVEQRHRQSIHAARGPARQVVGEVLRVMWSQIHSALTIFSMISSTAAAATVNRDAEYSAGPF